MAQANNQFMIMGNICKDIEIRLTTNQTKYAFVTIAVDGWTKDKGNKADFLSVCFWTSNAENVKKFCKKGDPIAVSGTIRSQSKDGKVSIQLVADAFFLPKGTGSKKEEEPKKEVNPENDTFTPVGNDPFAPY